MSKEFENKSKDGWKYQSFVCIGNIPTVTLCFNKGERKMSKGLKALKEYKNGLEMTEEEIDIIEQKLKRLEKLETKYEDLRVDYYTECLENEFFEKAIKIIKELFDFDFALRFSNNQSILMITNKKTKEYWELPISKEKYYLLKEVLE